MTDPAALIEKFYSAFQRRDGDAMAACYHADVQFRDPVFNERGERAAGMWRMLCARGKDLRIEFGEIQVSADRGSANWQAWYLFSATGRHVHNIITAEFKFRDGLIVEHVDSFDFWRWSRQALGPAGVLLGWSPLIQRKVAVQARQNLDKFLAQA